MKHARWHQAPFFSSLRPEQRERLERMAGTRHLASGQMLFHQDDPCTGFYVLTEGLIQLTRVGETPGQHPTLAVILPVSSFAEAAMFGDEAFPATAEAGKTSTVVHFPKDMFMGALREDPALALAVIHAQAVWLRKLTQKIQQLSSSDSLERLKHWLHEQLPARGEVLLPMTKKALAAQLGMTPETLSRSLRILQEQGHIQVQGARIRRD